jgi:cobalt-zinc-cadmium efflux system outer membrane protein
MAIKRAWAGAALLLLAGCYAPVRPEIDGLVCESAHRPVDRQPVFLPEPAAVPVAKGVPARPGEPPVLQLAVGQEFLGAEEQQAGPDGRQRRPTTIEQKLEVPPGIPGREAPRIFLPDPKTTPPDAMDKAIGKYFPPVPGVGADPQAIPGPGGQPLPLAELQKLARANSPQLRQAASDVEAARGAMIQAGLYPNPTVGFQSQTGGPGGGPNYGGFVEQTIKTWGKLKVAQAAAQMDYENAQIAYRRAENDLTANVRSAYFGVLVAEESIRENKALVTLSDELYKVLVRQLKGGEVAAYEPMQVGVFAAQARAALIQARNSYVLAWKQLATALGLPAMPPTLLAGSIRELPIPTYRYDTTLQQVLDRHTDVLTADNGVLKARYNLRLAEITAIPDVNVQTALVRDETPPGPARMVASVQVGVPFPLWDRNQGNVWQAKAQLVRAMEEPHRVRDDLTGRLAEAYRRYLENQQLLDLYHQDILPKQVTAFRSAVKRHYGGELGGVGYQDLVSAEQNLVSVIAAYLVVVQAQWQAVADVASFLQTDDLFQFAEGSRFAQMPDLEKLFELPCCHPCNPLPDPGLKQADPVWPPTDAGPSNRGVLLAPVALEGNGPALHPEQTSGKAGR